MNCRPVGQWVSDRQLPEPAQAAVFAGVYAALAVGTYASCTYIAPALSEYLPWLSSSFEASRGPVLGAFFAAAGVAHFTSHDAFTSMYPRPGAWGFWNLPGSPSFHVNWTGVAEILGGGALILTGLVPGLADSFPQLQPAAGLGLFALTLAVSPANIYMYTHNAPGPVPEPLPWTAHLFRLLLQIFLLASFWEIAYS
ncbi:hypothetical protein GPECTOR_3g82 [Gonium pectorale]|uniref:EXPERA domain-containing protein n=1 Tax=Gonium pectorale TaxID=33097 RepID=A0A150H0C6_GONPE|nr:hypothetical protein GPECTOR_3g82 [Gonium pectorale]|eukprot:KXZ55432.1 hypothetical protein GPECTOR_3g82 [Gonium pectorale]